VTAIAGRYAIGRVLEDGTPQVVLATESQSQRANHKGPHDRDRCEPGDLVLECGNK
jgi:hypothetical protein